MFSALPRFGLCNCNSKQSNFLLWPLISFFMSGCAISVEKKVAYNEDEHKAFIGKGTAEIEGEGFLRRPSGSLSRCSGGYVYLVPETAYFLEWVTAYQAGERFIDAQTLYERHKKAVRKTQCNMQGRFDFEKLPKGKWILVTRVTYDGSDWASDSTLMNNVETEVGEVTRVILSNPNRI